jgi:hypothetical protein
MRKAARLATLMISLVSRAASRRFSGWRSRRGASRSRARSSRPMPFATPWMRSPFLSVSAEGSLLMKPSEERAQPRRGVDSSDTLFAVRCCRQRSARRWLAHAGADSLPGAQPCAALLLTFCGGHGGVADRSAAHGLILRRVAANPKTRFSPLPRPCTGRSAPEGALPSLNPHSHSSLAHAPRVLSSEASGRRPVSLATSSPPASGTLHESGLVAFGRVA